MLKFAFASKHAFTGQIGRELEESLGLIEKVTAYVKIVRSFAIVSLQFLKSLKVIQGDRMFNDR